MHSIPYQAILLGRQEICRSTGITVNSVKAVVPYAGNDQELVTLLASYLNNRGASIIGWVLV